MSAMPATVAAESIAAVPSPPIPAIASVSTRYVWSPCAIGYRTWIVAAGAVCLRLRAVVALVSSLRFVVALVALVGGRRRWAASVCWPALAVWVVVLIVHNGAMAPR